MEVETNARQPSLSGILICIDNLFEINDPQIKSLISMIGCNSAVFNECP
jgi:hypothetical protein